MGGDTNSAVSIRVATAADLDDITWIACAAFPDDPVCDYQFPYRKEHPDCFRKWTRSMYEDYMEQPEKFVTLVATTTAVGQNAEHGTTRDDVPIAFAVWNVDVLRKTTRGDGIVHGRRDADYVHMMTVTTGLDYANAKYFAKYEGERLALAWLQTHPEYRRRGAARMLCKWGEEEARKKGWTLTVTASPLGRSVYQAIGWEMVGSEKIEADGEDEVLDFDLFVKRSSTK